MSDRQLPSACSKLGLDPSSNRFHAPIVYHENYSFPDWPQGHTFPMDKFKELALCLTTNCQASNPLYSTLSRPLVRSNADFFRPLDFKDTPKEWFQQPTGPIDLHYFQQFLSGSFSKEQSKKIGFRGQVSRRELIERTVLEVVGTILTCQLALQVCGVVHYIRKNYFNTDDFCLSLLTNFNTTIFIFMFFCTTLLYITDIPSTHSAE